MKKGKPEPLPRISRLGRVPPDQMLRRPWTAEEDDIIRQVYPSKGVVACVARLPGRTILSIYNRTSKLKVRRSNRTPRPDRAKKLDLTPDREAWLREEWAKLSGRGMTADLAMRLGVTRRCLYDTAVTLGLEIPLKTKEPRWSEAELELLRKHSGQGPDRISRMFRARGFKRSPVAVLSHAKRLDLSIRYAATYSATRASAILGIDSKTMTLRCIDGSLKSTRRGTRRLPQQGGDAWSIEREELRRFVLDELERIDIRKVDKFAFVDLLVGGLK